MKALFIWNESSLTLIEALLDTNKQFKNQARFITSKTSFNNLLPKKATDGLTSEEKKVNTEKKNVLRSFSKIYIQAELCWEDEFYDGYKYCFDLIEIWDFEPPAIHFFSFVSREGIYKEIDTKYKFLVKAFNHNGFETLLTEKKYKFPTNAIHKTKWEFFKYMTLTSYGVLNDLYHRLDSINSGRPQFVESLTNLVNDLKNYPDFIGEKVADVIGKVEFSDSYVQALRVAIQKRIVELSGKQSERLKLPEALNILVVDDHKEDLAHIKSSLDYYPNNIEYKSNGVDALKKVQLDEFDIVIIDLELLDENGFYQDVQGVELLEAVWETSGVAGVVTGMGTKGISKLLELPQELVLAKRHLHRFDIDEELDSFLGNLLRAYEKKDSGLVKILSGPSIGVFEITGFKTTLAKAYSVSDFKEECWAFAKMIATKFIRRELHPSDWNKSLGRKKGLNVNEFIPDKMGTLLAYRLIFLFLGIKNNGVILIDEEDYNEVLKSNEIPINKARVNMVGIHYDSNPTEGFVLGGGLKNVFTEEIVFINSIEKELKREKTVFIIKDTHPYTFKWLEKHFDFENEQFEVMGVPLALKDWQYADLEKSWNFIYKNFCEEESQSPYLETINSIVEDGLDLTIKLETEEVLPKLYSEIEKAGRWLAENYEDKA